MVKPKYYAQYKQDEFLDDVVFDQKSHGFFIDIGAHDGISYSNSYFFEKDRSYKGICIEPNPKVYEALSRNRQSQNLNLCLGNRAGIVKFLVVQGYGEMLSCIYDENDVQHLERINNAIEIHGGSKELIDIQVLTIEQLLPEMPRIIDFCTLDTEGYELEILKTVDFNKVHISAFTIEVNDESIITFMRYKGYVAFAKLGCDVIFLKKEIVNFAMRVRLLKYLINQKMNNILNRFRGKMD